MQTIGQVLRFGLVLTFFLASACKVEEAKLDPQSFSDGSGGNGGGDDGNGGNGGDGEGGTDGGSIGGGSNGGGIDGGLISTFKPALVVRATGCIMCHARVESTIITDFGHGADYAYGLNSGVSFVTQFSGAIYGNHAENWATSKVWGKIVVPTTGSALNGLSVANYLRSVVTAPDPMTAAPVVEEKPLIYIGAPSAARIMQVAGAMPVAHPEWKYFPSVAGSSLTGLEMAPGGNYMRNVAGTELVCSGDLVINSVVFLNDLQLRTTDKGCRIYATKSVFIQGQITYLGTALKRNLQVSSARAIIMGMGPGAAVGQPNNTLSSRLRDHWTRYDFFTRETGSSTQEKLDAIVLDSSYIPELLDASAQVPNGRNLAFERIFLNAPNYQSRYLGEFKGVIVAELAIASLNNFAFKFDTVFESVAILPLLSQADYLRVE